MTVENREREPGARTWGLIGRHWVRIPRDEDDDAGWRYFSSLSRPTKNLLAARWCAYEVRNGGIGQFLWNSSGVLAPEAFQGLTEIGLFDAALTLLGATLVLGERFPRLRADRQAVLNQLEMQFGARLFEKLDGDLRRQLECFEEMADGYAASREPGRA